ncbi:reverse transcriptase domain-containing protein [Tanacetum coccineum]
MKSNDQMMRNMQNQINSLKGDFKNEIQNTMKTQQTVLMNQQNAFQNNWQNMLSGFFQNQASTLGTLPSNTIPNPKVEQETEETTDKKQTNFQGNTAHIQPPVNPIPIPEPDVPKTLPKPNIPYPSRLNDQKFSPTIKNLLMNKEKLFELAKIPLNENCLPMLLKKLPEKLGDPGKFLIPCDFPGMDVCHALTDLGASINLMPLSIWEKLFLPELTPTRMTLELADRSITRPKGLAEDVFVKVGSFHFLTDFVVVDLKPILGTTPLSDSRPSLISFETSDLVLEDFVDELALLDPFPLRNEDVDFEAKLREIELLLNRDSSTDFSPNIMIDPKLERFINEPALFCLPPPGDDDDDKSFLKDDVQEVNFQVYSNPLFEFDDNYNSSDINPLFNKILEDVESKDSNVSNFDEPVLLNTPLFDEDECFDPGGDINKIDAFLDDYNDSEGDVFEIFHNTTHNLFTEVFFYHDPRSFKDKHELDKYMVKVFNPGIRKEYFSPTYASLTFEDRHYLSFTYFIRTFLYFFTYPVVSPFPLSSGSEDIIFDPGIYAFHFSSLEPVAFERQMEVCSSTCFIPMDN